MKSVFDGIQALHKAIQPCAELHSQIRRLQTRLSPASALEPALRNLLESQRRFGEVFRTLSLGPAFALSGELARHSRNARLLDDAGWLPHSSTPFDVVAACHGDSGALHDHLTRYYQDRWPQVHQGVLSRLDSHDVNEESKATFREALEAHRAGLFRCVPPTLMLAIERVSRVDLHGGSFDPITSQQVLIALVEQLPISSVQPRGFYGLALCKRLSDHLYERCLDPQARDRFARDPVPNRHAAVHGHVAYSSMQPSLNMIFMAEFIFHVIGLAKRSEAAPVSNVETAALQKGH